MLYFDYQTASFPTDGVLQALKPFEKEQFGTLLAAHDFGQRLHRSLEEARAHLRALTRAGEEEVVLLAPSGAEAVNQVVFGVYLTESRKLGKNHFLVGQNDEASAILSVERLEEFDCYHDLLRVDDRGQIDSEALGASITPRTALVSVTSANGLTGSIQPLGEISEICRAQGVLLHVDVTHSLASHELETAQQIDFITFHGEQLHGPKAAAALIVRRGLDLAPLVINGQESACHSQVHPAGLIGLGQAAKEALERRAQINTQVARTRYLFEREICQECPEIQTLMGERERVPHISVLAFPGVSSELMAYTLNSQGLYASFGGGQFQQIHYLLSAMGIEGALAQSALSFSFSHLTSLGDSQKGAQIIVETYRKLRKLSEAIA